MQLYNYQKSGKDFLKARRYALLADDMGLGKSAQAITAAAELGCRKVLIICPASVKFNWKKEINKWTPGQYVYIVEDGRSVIPDSNYTLINYDLIHRKKIFLQLISRHYGLIICDECFHQDTLIKTKTGMKKIKYVRAGDYVWNCTGWDKVTGYYLKKLDYYIKIRYNGRDIKVSENHPFFTLKGWVKAKDLKKGDSLVTTEESQEILYAMRERATRRDTHEEKILQHLLLREMADGSAGDNRKDEEPGTAVEDFRGVEARPRGKDPRREEKMSGMALGQLDQSAGSCSTPENKLHFETYKVVPRRSGWEWKTTSNTPEQTFKIARQVVASRVLRSSKTSTERVSDTLQDRYSISPFKISSRDRRVLTSSHRAEKTRHKEDKLFKTYRVESVEVYKYRSDGGRGEGLADNIFFDLSVEKHPSFTVNGALVHNSHYIKNFNAKRTKCVYYPKGLKDRADRVWLLTGTPVLNRPVELYSHLKALVPERLGPYASYRRFAERYCAAYESKWGLDVSGASNLGELSGKLDGFMLRRLKKDVLQELPDKTYQTITLPSSKAQTTLAKKERDYYGQEKENYLGELASLRRQSGLAKIIQAVEHIKNVLEEKEKVVVFAYHKDVIAALRQALADFGPVTLTGSSTSVQRIHAVDAFQNNGSTRVFIGQIEAAGTGIDGLQNATDTVIFAELTWTPGQIHQAVDRCHRIGQKSAVLVQFLTVPGSIDEDIAETIARKEEIIRKVVKPTQKEETEMDKRVQVIVTVEVDAANVCDAVVAVGDGLALKNAEVVKIHSAQALLAPPGGADAAVSAVVSAKPTAVEAPTPKVEPVKRGRKAKETPAAPTEDGADFGEGIKAIEKLAGEPEMDGPGLMKYCNSALVKVTDPAQRATTIKKVAALFREKFNVIAIKELPTDRVAEAKQKFDEIMAV